VDRSSPAGVRRARVALVIAAVVVVAATVGLAGYVRSAAKGSDLPAAGPAVDDRGAPAGRTPAGPAARAPSPSARAPVPDAPGGSRDSASAAPALPDPPLAEDRFLGEQGAPTPPPAAGAARPPDPPSEPTDPEPTVADDPRDFELPTGQSQ
jgi:hypothetical protein